MENLQIFLSTYEELKGQFVMVSPSWTVERLVAVGEDQWDYYWVTYDGKKLSWFSCLSKIMPLKGHLRDEDYSDLTAIAKLNHFDQMTSWSIGDPLASRIFVDQHRLDLEKIPTEVGSLITPICWDLN